MLSAKISVTTNYTTEDALTVLGLDGLDVEHSYSHIPDSEGVRNEFSNSRRP